MPRKSARRRAIEARIVDAVRRATALGYTPNRLYLTEDDLADLVATWPRLREPFKVDGMPVKLAAHSSRMVCKFGASTSV